MKQGSLALILLCSLIGAISPSAYAYPDWALTPPADTAQWFYTIGAGPSAAVAKQNALAELANRLQVKVQATSQQFVDAQASGNQFLSSP